MDLDKIAGQYAETTVDYANAGYPYSHVRMLVAEAFKAGFKHRETVFDKTLKEVIEREQETLKRLAE